MNTQQKRRSQAFHRAEDWLIKHPAMAALVAPLLAALQTVVATLDDAAIKQDGYNRSGKGSTAEATQLRKAILADMRIISGVAVAAIPDVVKATAALEPPAKNVDVDSVHTSAEAMAREAEAHLDVLNIAGLPPDIIPQLRVIVAKYRAAINERGQAVAQRHGATESVTVQLNRARDLVNNISQIVTKALRSDPVTLAEWKQLKRVTLKGVQRSREETGEGTTPVAPNTTVQPSASKATEAQEQVT